MNMVGGSLSISELYEDHCRRDVSYFVIVCKVCIRLGAANGTNASVDVQVLPMRGRAAPSGRDVPFAIMSPIVRMPFE